MKEESNKRLLWQCVLYRLKIKVVGDQILSHVRKWKGWYASSFYYKRSL